MKMLRHWLGALGMGGVWDPLPGVSWTESLSRAGGEQLRPHGPRHLCLRCVFPTGTRWRWTSRTSGAELPAASMVEGTISIFR